MIAALGLPLMLPFLPPIKKMPSDERASPVSLGEFICLSLSLAAAVGFLWLLTKPWEDDGAHDASAATASTHKHVVPLRVLQSAVGKKWEK